MSETVSLKDYSIPCQKEDILNDPTVLHAVMVKFANKNGLMTNNSGRKFLFSADPIQPNNIIVRTNESLDYDCLSVPEINEGDAFSFWARVNPNSSFRGERQPFKDCKLWLDRQAQRRGFELTRSVKFHARTIHCKLRPMHIFECVFIGDLRVTDSTLFQKTLAEGFGDAKAYGYGLMQIV